MSTLRVTFFGGFHAVRDDFPIKNFHSQKAQLLLSYLLLYRQKSHPRAVLADLLGGDSGEGNRTLASLRAALHSLRQLIEGPKSRFGKYILTEATAVRFNTESAYRLDVEEFEKALASARSASGEARADLLRQAVELYQGDLLAGFYEDWVLIEQQHFKELYLQALRELITHHQERQEYAQAIDQTRRVLEENPLHEEVHRWLMQLYLLSGDRAAALKQYAECKAVLKRELNIAPLPETKDLYEKILASGPGKIEESEEPAPPPRDNLPHFISRFIGRKKEIEEIKRLIIGVSVDRRVRSVDPGGSVGSPLLTLTGTGGSGKTRLAVEVARALSKDFADGVWFVELSSLRDPGLLPPAVAFALGLREQSGQSPLVTLTEYLKPKQLLLVLDNCEHVVDACAPLAQTLLLNAPRLRMLATSREGLHIDGETVWKTPPLLMPNPQSLMLQGDALVKALATYEAIALFVDRAMSSNPEFALTSENAEAIEEICRRLDGIPLAIELAAARVNVLSVDEIVRRLDSALSLLTQGSRTAAPSHHQTLRATLDWSYQLLSEPEQMLLARLSVFSGGFTLPGVEAVCAGETLSQSEMLDLMAQLVNKSLVSVEHRDGKVRYRLLEIVRQYAQEKLDALGEVGCTRERHGHYFLRLAERAKSELNGPDQRLWLDRLEAEHDNLRTALANTAAGEAKLRFAEALWRFWFFRGYFSEGRRWLEETLATSHGAPIAVRAEALNGAGVFAMEQADYEHAVSLYEESLALRRELGDRKGVANSLNNLGLIAYNQGDFERAARMHTESLALRREVGEKWGVASSLNNLGVVAHSQGDYEKATAFYDESLALKRELGDQRGISYSLSNLGVLAYLQGKYEQAVVFYEESLQIRRALSDKMGVAGSLINLASVRLEQGKYRQSIALSKEGLAVARELGAKALVIECVGGLASALGVSSDPEQAARLFGAVEALSEAFKIPVQAVDRANFERKVALTRSRLSPEIFAAAWAMGRAMSLEQAIEYALQEEKRA
ncbi:tetratricopeptide repeat protein [Candidatus Acetothermia bacterium]|nr:tetratricopeptide repeat protein [Candidatus Acetothermia bacterium]